MRRTGPARLLLCALLVMATAACGPLVSTSEIREAQRAFDRAEIVRAEQLATYEFVLAQQYLAKAREEWGYSDFQQARAYAIRALEAAEAAHARALREQGGAPDQRSPRRDDGR